MQYKSVSLQNFLTIDELVLVHYFEYSSEIKFAGEKHDFWEFVYVDNGCVEIFADNKQYIVQSGEVIFHKPNEFHTIAAHNKTNPNLIIISFIAHGNHMQFFNNYHNKATAQQKMLLHKVLHETRLAFKNILHQPSYDICMIRRENASAISEQLIKLYLELFLIDIYREAQIEKEEFEHGTDLSFMLPQCNNLYITDTLVYLNNNIPNKLKISQICQEIGIGRSRLQQLFNNEFGCGVIEYFNALKAVAAKDLLRSTSVNINDIADMLGFTSVAYFSRYFKNTFGITPTKYRKTIYDATKSATDITKLKKK